MTDKLTYDELKLGERAKEAFLEGKSIEHIKNNCPVYLNTREVYAGLNVTDSAIGFVLAGIPGFLIGNAGCGKSQLARDFHNYYFNGSKKDGGEGITIPGDNELDIYTEVLTDVDMQKMTRVLNGNQEALYFDLEEFNRCPSPTQNQFYAMMNGRLIHKGTSTPIGRRGYRACIATANLGNGEFQGTFGIDKALLNRFGVVLDFDYLMFKPAREDEMLINVLREADPGIKEAPRRDLTEKVLQAFNEISDISNNIGIESMAVVNYLRFGLRNCQGPKSTDVPREKEKTWSNFCQDCERNPKGDYLCSLIREPQQRTIESMIRYASSLQYLIKLKNPKRKINAVELMFTAFELTGAYQHLLNPNKLAENYSDANPKMMHDIVEILKTDFRKNEDFIITSLESAKQGKKASFCRHNNKIFAGYDELSEQEKADVEKYEPFHDNREVGLSWLKDAEALELKILKERKEKEKENPGRK